MAHIRKVERRRGPRGYAWQVRYRDPDRKERSRTFLTKDQAERFARKVEVTKDEGSYINPSLGKTLFEDWAQEWMASVSPTLKPITTSGYRSLLNNHVLPTFRGMTLAAVRPMDIRRFVGDLVNRLRLHYLTIQNVPEGVLPVQMHPGNPRRICRGAQLCGLLLLRWLGDVDGGEGEIGCDVRGHDLDRGALAAGFFGAPGALDQLACYQHP